MEDLTLVSWSCILLIHIFYRSVDSLEKMANLIYKEIMADNDIDSVFTRHHKFTAALDTDDVFPVFYPLNEKLVKELHLIREVSIGLQKKKDDEIKRAAEAKAEAEEKPVTKKETEVEEKESS